MEKQRVALIVDLYHDEPASLGVPPFIGPFPRYAYGAARSVLERGSEGYALYATIDDLRNLDFKSEKLLEFLVAERKGSIADVRDIILCLMGGCAVPGKYIRSMPASTGEAQKVLNSFIHSEYGSRISEVVITSGILSDSSASKIKNRHYIRAKESKESRYESRDNRCDRNNGCNRDTDNNNREYTMDAQLAYQSRPHLSGRIVQHGVISSSLHAMDICLKAVLENEWEFNTDISISSGEIELVQARSETEWNRHALAGTEAVLYHQDFPLPLTAEIQPFQGCPRYISGGCAFCCEPLKGRPVFRQPEDVVKEVRKLYELGVRCFRIGAQTCIYSYLGAGVGVKEVVTPNPAAVETLFKGIREACPDIRCLHVDNANPAVIANCPYESERISHTLVRYCTDGNVVAFGLESADPLVQKANNLNCTAEEALEAVRIVNEIGSARGSNGMPSLLPGINFLGGLAGETAESYAKNKQFLHTCLEKGFMLRRINIRQVDWRFRGGVPAGNGEGDREGRYKKIKFHAAQFERFKKWVREEVDTRMLKQVVPIKTRLRGIYIELDEGRNSFGRQPGTYPLLVGFRHNLNAGQRGGIFRTTVSGGDKVNGVDRVNGLIRRESSPVFYDALVTEYGMRSVTAIEQPFDVKNADLNAWESLPGIGKKRAQRLHEHNSLKKINRKEDIFSALDTDFDKELLEDIEFSFG